MPESGWFGIRAARQMLVSAATAIKLTTTAAKTGPELQKQTSITADYLRGGRGKCSPVQQKDVKVFFFFSAASINLLCVFVEDPACVQSACGQTDGRRDEG